MKQRVWLNETELAERLTLTVKAVQNWRYNGKGPIVHPNRQSWNATGLLGAWAFVAWLA